jgi:hypothetical protein
MTTRVLTAAVLGFLVLVLWTFVVNGMLGFTARLTMNRVADEPAVHRLLTQNVPAPGAYIVNPALTADHRFPDGAPVFAVTHSGIGHEGAGRMMLVDLGRSFALMLLAAGLLAVASDRVLARWTWRAAFVVALGVLLALGSDLTRVGIGGWPASTAIAMAGFLVGGWALAGAAIAWAMRPHTRHVVDRQG